MRQLQSRDVWSYCRHGLLCLYWGVPGRDVQLGCSHSMYALPYRSVHLDSTKALIMFQLTAIIVSPCLHQCGLYQRGGGAHPAAL